MKHVVAIPQIALLTIKQTLLVNVTHPIRVIVLVIAPRVIAKTVNAIKTIAVN